MASRLAQKLSGFMNKAMNPGLLKVDSTYRFFVTKSSHKQLTMKLSDRCQELSGPYLANTTEKERKKE